ncbi:amino-acid N-acetyltransferase [Methylophilaceae bacterium]|jgi:amino-acid N-acetyltransferase|nr:amino-acid N-acetyltransferase [Methylophilaceae bacterium]
MNPGQIVRKLRQEQNMTLACLANLLNLDPGNLSRIERNELKISFNLLEKLSLAFNVSPLVFFDKVSPQNKLVSEAKSFIENFRLSAKFINQFNNKTFVIALGGEVISDNQLKSIACDINLLHSMNINIILVHGIRPQIDNKLKGKINKNKLIRNIRVTKKEMLNDIVEVNGIIKTNIEATLSSGILDSPLLGSNIKVSSGNFITARPLGVIDGVDMELTGQIRKIDTNAITDKLNNREIVIISPLGYSPIGDIFNLSYEQTAAHVAQAIKAEKLIYYINTNGILNIRGELIPELTISKAKHLIESIEDPNNAPFISYHDFNILKSSLYAIKNNIEKVHLINRNIDGSVIEEIFTDKGSGTVLTEHSLQNIRAATIRDIKQIINIIEPLEKEGILIDRINNNIDKDINSFYVIEHGHNIIGTVALYQYEEMIEVACFAIHENYQNLGYGKKLLKFCEQIAINKNIQKLFILTTQSEHWFIENDFSLTDRKLIPDTRKKTYTIERNSKYFIKRL